jgi:hypothetical protein
MLHQPAPRCKCTGSRMRPERHQHARGSSHTHRKKKRRKRKAPFSLAMADGAKASTTAHAEAVLRVLCTSDASLVANVSHMIYSAQSKRLLLLHRAPLGPTASSTGLITSIDTSSGRAAAHSPGPSSQAACAMAMLSHSNKLVLASPSCLSARGAVDQEFHSGTALQVQGARTDEVHLHQLCLPLNELSH